MRQKREQREREGEVWQRNCGMMNAGRREQKEGEGEKEGERETRNRRRRMEEGGRQEEERRKEESTKKQGKIKGDK